MPVETLTSTPTSPDAQLMITNPQNATGAVAGIILTTASGWKVILRTVQNTNWLQLCDGNGAVQSAWDGPNYTAIGTVTAGGLKVSGPSVVLSGLSGLPGSGTADLTVNSSGTVAPQTSSLRFKEDVQPLSDDFHKILALEPKSFRYKESGDRAIGYAAEDLDALGLDGLVGYDPEGQPLTINYKLLPIYLIEVVKEQQRTIRDLQDRVTELASR